MDRLRGKGGIWMAGSVLTLGVILAIIAIVVGFILVRSNSAYYVSFLLFVAGLTFVTISSMADLHLFGTPLGGWGIASLFAAGIGFVITSIVDAYRNTNQSFQ